MWHHYLEILRDPAHLMVEVTLMLLVDVLFMGVALPFIKRAVLKHDRKVHGTTATTLAVTQRLTQLEDTIALLLHHTHNTEESA